MKNLGSVLPKLTLGLALAASVAACNQNKTADKPAAASSSSSSDKPEIVYVNQDTLYLKYNYIKDMNTRLDTKSKAAQADLQSRQQAIQREYVEYQKNAATMSANDRATKEQLLQREGQTFQQYQQNAGAQFQNETADEQKKLYDKVSDFMKQYAKEKGYKLILTYQHGDAHLLYGDPSLDVTADVVKGLNDAYSKDKK